MGMLPCIRASALPGGIQPHFVHKEVQLCVYGQREAERPLATAPNHTEESTSTVARQLQETFRQTPKPAARVFLSRSIPLAQAVFAARRNIVKTVRDNIVITRSDYEKLRPLVDGGRAFNGSDAQSVGRLAQELDRAEIVESDAMPGDVITMNSRATLRDLDSGELKEYRLIFPTQERQGNDVSILAPIGTAMLGYRVGDVIEWQVPRGIRRFEVVEVLYQPEAQGVSIES